ncbi:MAG TPA: glycoside hydrolase family 75 protein [Chroococcales cyanobacterium]
MTIDNANGRAYERQDPNHQQQSAANEAAHRLHSEVHQSWMAQRTSHQSAEQRSGNDYGEHTHKHSAHNEHELKKSNEHSRWYHSGHGHDHRAESNYENSTVHRRKHNSPRGSHEGRSHRRNHDAPTEDRGDASYPQVNSSSNGHSQIGDQIAQHARDGVGHALWRNTEFRKSVQGGNLGCAASVSERLQGNGFDYANSASVGGLTDQLTAHGWTKHPISEARPGDVIYGYRGDWHDGGGNAHVGIMGFNGEAYGNSSGTGKWTSGGADQIIPARRFGQHRYCLRPPGSGSSDGTMATNDSSSASSFNGTDRTRATENIEPPQRVSFSPDQNQVANALNTVTDKTVPPEQRLEAVRQLAAQGINNFNLTSPDGRNFSIRTEAEQMGNNQCVHLFMTGPDGRERVVMRGVATADGMQRQVSQEGDQMSWQGSAGAAFDRMFASRGNGSDRAEPSDRSAPSGAPEQTSQPTNQQATGGLDPNKFMDDSVNEAENMSNQLVTTTNGVYMRARMDVDADGSPRAPEIDPYGSTETSLTYTDGSFINAENVPYMVLPKNQYQQYGVKPGDMCLVRNRENGKMAIAVFADVGPSGKRGEGSMELNSEMGLVNNPIAGGTENSSIDYLVLPGSGMPVANEQELLARINDYRESFGLGRL